MAILETKELFVQEVTGLTLAEASIKLGVDEATIARRCNMYNCREIMSISTRSKWEFKLTEFLLNLGLIEGVDFIRGNKQLLAGKELDFYFPNYNFAIEVGSLFWHSELNANRGKQYHYEKWQMCKEQGIDLLQYWDYELANSWHIVENKIKYMLGLIKLSVGARKITKIATVPLSDEKQFMLHNHIQGFSGDRKISLGAYIVVS